MSSPLDSRIIPCVTPLNNDHSFLFGDCYNIKSKFTEMACDYAIPGCLSVLPPLVISFCARSRGEIAMKSQGEIESAICEGVNRFEQEYMG
ncbi:MAG: hypothetical protein WD065_03890, partial [Planctomycetaceae bacterium]